MNSTRGCSFSENKCSVLEVKHYFVLVLTFVFGATHIWCCRYTRFKKCGTKKLSV